MEKAIQNKRQTKYVLLSNQLRNTGHLSNKWGALKSASIDVLYSTDGKYYFLEVNPIGQFGMVSYPCNYFLEKRIAQELNKFECA